MARKEKKEKRFVCILTESSRMENNSVWVDTQTGVNYLYHSAGYSGGLTPLLDRDGKPVVSGLPLEAQ